MNWSYLLTFFFNRTTACLFRELQLTILLMPSCAPSRVDYFSSLCSLLLLLRLLLRLLPILSRSLRLRCLPARQYVVLVVRFHAPIMPWCWLIVLTLFFLFVFLFTWSFFKTFFSLFSQIDILLIYSDGLLKWSMFSTEHPSAPNPMFTDDLDTEIRTESSTPELNLLLVSDHRRKINRIATDFFYLKDKLTEILRFRSACRRRHHHPSSVPGNLKRLQLTSNEPSHSHANEISSSSSSSPSSSSSSSTTGAAAAAMVETGATFDGTTGGAWKSSHVQSKPSITNRPSVHHHHHHHHAHHHHHHHRHHQNQFKLFSNEKKRRLPCLLQRLIDDGNLIKEAVRRLKSQRFPAACQQQQQQLSMGDSPSTPTKKSSFPLLSASIPISSSLNNSPSQSASSPNVNLSWFLSSNVVFSPVNHPSENGSPMRTLMEIGIHDG